VDVTTAVPVSHLRLSFGSRTCGRRPPRAAAVLEREEPPRPPDESQERPRGM